MLLKEKFVIGGYEYTSLLFRERKQELKALEQRYKSGQLSGEEYRSCRRALLQAIGEISNVMLQIKQIK